MALGNDDWIDGDSSLYVCMADDATAPTGLINTMMYDPERVTRTLLSGLVTKSDQPGLINAAIDTLSKVPSDMADRYGRIMLTGDSGLGVNPLVGSAIPTANFADDGQQLASYSEPPTRSGVNANSGYWRGVSAMGHNVLAWASSDYDPRGSINSLASNTSVPVPMVACIPPVCVAAPAPVQMIKPNDVWTPPSFDPWTDTHTESHAPPFYPTRDPGDCRGQFKSDLADCKDEDMLREHAFIVSIPKLLCDAKALLRY